MNEPVQALRPADVAAGDVIPSVSIPVTLQRLVMESGANRDFSLIHHDAAVARSTGAPDAFANTFFLVGMFERMLREWAGPAARIRAIRNLRMQKFNAVGDVVTFTGRVREVSPEDGAVILDIESKTDNGTTVTAEALVELRVGG